ncbi:hypothetical protein [Micromonospora parathelypteridis]|uniref:Uncharacterized protein n=1 Tax=Micromonospora parathelypteridis TaxID=1839617 RepID=A0A840W7M2_9ACTN|nr:hypothetical protein [Micromonospora parathelypteridis]MBB5480750.1 hypothetical protein [Micromonospora parathelypteridis]
MNPSTPYAAVLQVDDAAGHAVLDVLSEAFSIDPIARQIVPSRWLAPTAGRVLDAEHPDVPEVVRPARMGDTGREIV